MTTDQWLLHSRICRKPFDCPVCALKGAHEGTMSARGWVRLAQVRGVEKSLVLDAVLTALAQSRDEIKGQLDEAFQLWRETL